MNWVKEGFLVDFQDFIKTKNYRNVYKGKKSLLVIKMVMKNKNKFLLGFALSVVLVAVLVAAVNLGTAPGIQLTVNGSESSTAVAFINGTFEEDTNFMVNLTINNSLNSSSGGNITYINITMPGNFYFVPDSNGSGLTNLTNATNDAFRFNVTNTTGRTQVLNWSNSSKSSGLGIGFSDQNSTTTAYWFNATVDTPGTYNMSVYWMLNGTSIGHENVTIVVNDTTNVTNANWTTSANDVRTNESNLSATGIRVNLTWAENGIMGDINITLMDVNRLVLNSSVNNVSMINATNGTGGYSYYVNFTNTTGLPDGIYYINVTVLNDSVGHNRTGDVLNTKVDLFRKITLDTTAPTVSFSCSPTTDVNVGETVTCSCSGTDTTTAVKSSVYNSTGDSTVAKEVTEACKLTDYANNSKTASVTYTVFGSGDGVAGGGGGGGGSATATKTVVITDEQFEAGHTTQLKANEQAKVKVDGVNHYVSVDAVADTTVKIIVSSEPQESTLSVGDTRKFDVNNDSNYDVSVKLNAITGGKADLTILSISEQVTAESEAEQQASEEEAGEVAEEEIAQQEGSQVWIYVIVVIIILIVVGIVVWKKRQ